MNMLKYSKNILQKPTQFSLQNLQKRPAQLYAPVSLHSFSSENLPEKKSFFSRLFSNDSTLAPADSNRWMKMVPAALCHLCIGGPYAWSVMASALTKEYGVVASSALDWTLSQSTFALSITFFMQGVSAACVGGLQMKYGLRPSMLAASAFYCSGVMVGAFGIYCHSLPLLYLGYGFLAGTGVGTVYTPPIQALMEWFPDRKGLASGVCIAGFGSGALIMAPYVQNMMAKFQKIPEYVGQMGSVETFTESGRLFAKIGGEAKEVILATANDLAQLPGGGIGLQEGLYVVGTGNTGAAAALASLGLIYTGVLFSASLALKKPATPVIPPGFNPAQMAAVAPVNNVHHNVVMKTPQFWCLMTFLCAIASGGVGVMSVSKSMMIDQFQVLLPSVVTTAFATSFVLTLSAGNMLGRLGWTQLFDLKGGKFVYNTFGGLAIPLYITLPFCIGAVVSEPSTLPLYGFIGSTFFIVSIMGGTYASLPAYEAQLFGTKYVGAIHGKMLLGSSFSAMFGPNFLISMRNYEEQKAINNLLKEADPVKFQETFSAGIDQAQQLIEAKTLTINKLMTCVPPEIKDPSPYLYDSAMYSFAGFMGVAAIAHTLLKPVDPKYFEKVERVEEKQEEKEQKQQEEKEEQEEEQSEKKEQK